MVKKVSKSKYRIELNIIMGIWFFNVNDVKKD